MKPLVSKKHPASRGIIEEFKLAPSDLKVDSSPSPAKECTKCKELGKELESVRLEMNILKFDRAKMVTRIE